MLVAGRWSLVTGNLGDAIFFGPFLRFRWKDKENFLSDKLRWRVRVGELTGARVEMKDLIEIIGLSWDRAFEE